jgi:manganese transport protein
VYFYSSGGVEEDWTPKDLLENKIITTVGFTLGMILSFALLILGAAYFLPKEIFPFTLGTAALSAASTMGRTGLLMGLIGMLCCIAGAAVETCLAGAYNVCQFFDLPWGRKRPARETPVFTALWVAIFIVAMGIVLAGVDPLKLVEFSVIFAVVVLPLTYWPILNAAGDRKFMGKHVNSPIIQVAGWVFWGIVTVCAGAALPLMIYTHQGQP